MHSKYKMMDYVVNW